METRIIALGWEYRPNYGWTHWDVRDNDGERVMFDSADAVARHIGLEQCEECGA